MSHNSVRDAGGMAGAPPSLGDAIPAREGDLAPEIKDALISRAKEIIAGRVRPPAMVAPPGVETFLQQEFGAKAPPPTSEAVRRVTERLSLQAQYAGRPVACFTTADGSLAVLASGDREVEALLRGLSESEAAMVVVTDTESF